MPDPRWLQKTEPAVDPNDLALDHGGVFRCERHNRARHVSRLEPAPAGAPFRRSRKEFLSDAPRHHRAERRGIDRRRRHCVDSHTVRRHLGSEVAHGSLRERLRHPEGRVIRYSP